MAKNSLAGLESNLDFKSNMGKIDFMDKRAAERKGVVNYTAEEKHTGSPVTLRPATKKTNV